MIRPVVLKTKCRSFRFDKITTFKRSKITENIIGAVKEFDDKTELEKPMLNLENKNRRIDALDI